MTEILVIAVLALLVLGPEKLPKVAQMIGKGLREIRRATSDIRQAIDIDETRSQFQNDLKSANWGRAGQLDDPYRNTTPPEDDEDESSPQIGPYGVADEEDDETYYDDAVLVSDDDGSASSDSEEHEPITTITLAPWHSLTRIGVFIQRQYIATVRPHTLDT
ncbi:MAG: twin-arginine translocase TatA/TatE family subunit, partial [Myxococcota bacterium]